MKRRTVELPLALTAALGKLGPDACVLGHDPGSASTGLAYVVGGRTVFSTQGAPRDVAARWGAVFRGARVDLYVREGPYPTVRVDEGRERAQSHALHVLGFSAGWVTCALDGEVRTAALWEPPPMTWRALLGLNRRASSERSARDETALAVWRWARATSVAALETSRGARCFDEANAIGLAHAGASIIDGARRTL